MLEVHELFFRYGKKSPSLLKNLSFHLNKGEFVMLLGANGTGKSTLLALLNGWLKPDSGTVMLNGKDLAALPAQLRSKQIATVHQLPEELPDFTVEELVMLGRFPYLARLGGPAEEDLQAMTETLDLLELSDRKNRKITQLSGGEKQRAFLAAALVRKTPWLLLDEPTSAADPAHRCSLIRILKELPWKPGILMATHDITAAQSFGDRFLLLYPDGSLNGSTALDRENVASLYGKDAVFFLK